jgi:hypothetical protein
MSAIERKALELCIYSIGTSIFRTRSGVYLSNRAQAPQFRVAEYWLLIDPFSLLTP